MDQEPILLLHRLRFESDANDSGEKFRESPSATLVHNIWGFDPVLVVFGHRLLLHVNGNCSISQSLHDTVVVEYWKIVPHGLCPVLIIADLHVLEVSSDAPTRKVYTTFSCTPQCALTPDNCAYARDLLRHFLDATSGKDEEACHDGRAIWHGQDPGKSVST